MWKLRVGNILILVFHFMYLAGICDASGETKQISKVYRHLLKPYNSIGVNQENMPRDPNGTKSTKSINKFSRPVHFNFPLMVNLLSFVKSLIHETRNLIMTSYVSENSTN